MSHMSYFRLLAQCNLWMNEKLHNVCESLPTHIIKKGLHSYFNSIFGTFNYLLLVDNILMFRFTQQSFHVTGLSKQPHSDFPSFREDRELTDHAITHFIEHLSTIDLGLILLYPSLVKPQPRLSMLWDALTYFLSHQTHHRAQITTPLSPLEVDVGVTNLFHLPDLMSRGSDIKH